MAQRAAGRDLHSRDPSPLRWACRSLLESTFNKSRSRRVDHPWLLGAAGRRARSSPPTQSTASSPKAIAAAHRGVGSRPKHLAHAVFYATLTNVVAFLPLLLVKGKTGDFIYSLPIVVSWSLVAAMLVAWTIAPLLGFYMLKGQKAALADREAS